MHWAITLGALCALLAADIKLRLLTRRWVAVACLLAVPHGILILGSASLPYQVLLIASGAYFLLRFSLHVTPCALPVGLRVRVMMGGRRIFLASLLASLMQIPICALLLLYRSALDIPWGIMTADMVATFGLPALLMISASVRIFWTSRRLGITRRLLFLINAWVPLVNILLGVWFCRIVRQEFQRACVQTELQNARADSRVCETKYPLLLLHGVGFRDYKYVNYWGRIPALLIKNGATIYHGHQQAWGTIEGNAKEIEETLLGIVEERGCEKVNIIAHSKGGLDARYLISSLEMAPHMASLTTIATPHRGSELVNVISRLPEAAYRRICGWINAYWKRMGDTAPDAFTASKQLMPEFLEGFNRENRDCDGVYYQSYAAEMKAPPSNSLLAVPNAVMQWVAGNNDGLVTTDSARWGTFKGAFKSSTLRGISHGDLIDLMHQDYEGFDIGEDYVALVAELKAMGL